MANENSTVKSENVQFDDFYQEPTILCSFKFAQTTSVKIKRTLSVFKNMLTGTRHSFTEGKLEINIVNLFNNKYN